jgi:hypothetical protein
MKMVEQERIKETLITWNSAVVFHNSGNYNEAIEQYHKIQVLSARMRYNMACAEIKLDKELAAIQVRFGSFLNMKLFVFLSVFNNIIL